MSAKLQLIKWTLPAFALIFGLFWYKRRRVDRVDPGGNLKLGSDSNLNKSDSIGPRERTSSRCDSGVHTDESSSLNSSSAPGEELSLSPRKVSESLDIPIRRSPPQPISLKSGKSVEESSRPWYDDVESLPELRRVQLSSNPTSCGFAMMAQDRSSLEVIHQEHESMKPVTKVAEEVAKSEKLDLKCEVTTNVSDKQSEEAKQESEIHAEGDEKGAKEQQFTKDEGNQGQIVIERDSANHSPVSGVLEGSVTDDVRSEGSTDSGKGGSIKGHTVNFSQTTYDFWVPQSLVGKLIGRQGTCLQNIRMKSGAKVNIKKRPALKDHNLCVIEGSPEAIQIALGLVRKMFPEKRFPNFTMEQVTTQKLAEEIPWLTELMHLSLVEGLNNDVVVCHVVKPNRLFVQLPTHPTYPSLRILDENMTQLYQNIESPTVPMELRRGMIVVVKWFNKWVRAHVENPDPKGEQTVVRLLDHGGYWTVNHMDMRKIRSDYLTLPFQAIEVFIANIKPKDGEWKKEAFDVVAHLCSGIVGQAQIVGYIDSNIYISLFFNIQKHGLISVAEELIVRGFAEPISLEETVPEEIWPNM